MYFLLSGWPLGSDSFLFWGIRRLVLYVVIFVIAYFLHVLFAWK